MEDEPPTLMALSVEIPWATLLVTGDKLFETRTWPLPRNLVGQRCAIASTARFGKYHLEVCRRMRIKGALKRAGIRIDPLTQGIVPGAVLGTVRWKQCLPALAALDEIRSGRAGAPNEEKLGHYRYGWWAWEAEEPEMFDTPIPCKGKQRVWKWEGAHALGLDR